MNMQYKNKWSHLSIKTHGSWKKKENILINKSHSSLILSRTSQNLRHFTTAHNFVYAIITLYSLNCSPEYAYPNRYRFEVAPGNQKKIIISIILRRILRKIAIIFIMTVDNCKSKTKYLCTNGQTRAAAFPNNSDDQFTVLALVQRKCDSIPARISYCTER